MRIVGAGVSGFLGSALTKAAADRGHEVVQLVRRPPDKPDQAQWDPDSGDLDLAVLRGADVVVNLCGVPVQHRWTDEYKQLVRTSRVVPTQLLAQACVDADVPNLVNAAAVGYYGPRGDEIIDESARVGQDFLADVVADWEAATSAAADGGVRVVNLRTGLVLGTEGLLPLTSLTTKLFAGGRLGSGRQYMPWISETDWVDAVLWLMQHPEVAGPVNICGPAPVTNREYTATLGKALHRPTPWIVPPFALKVLFGEVYQNFVTGQRAIPAKLEDGGFVFSHATLAEALRAELH